MQEVIIGYQGEMSLKGLNRNQFESALIKILRYRLKDAGRFAVWCAQSTFYIEPEDDAADLDLAFDRVKKVFGLAAVSRSAVCEKDFDAICATAESYLGQTLNGVCTFKVEARRADKTFPMDSPALMRELGAYYDRVVCCGGDGTLSETAAGLMGLSRPPVLGYIPSGSTNDCAATLHIPRSYKKAAELAAGEKELLRWDIGSLNGQSFVYVAAFGAFTEVAYDTPQDLKNTFGHLAYIAAGIASIPSITPYHLKVEFDGQTLEDDFFYGMVCNTDSVAGMKNLPTDRIVLDDGLFEVIPASQLKFTSEKPIPWTVDGEYGGSHQVSRLQNHRQALTILSGRA